MAACGSLQPLFDNPLPESPTLLIESLSVSSWNNSPSFTDLFGELHFKENHSLPNNRCISENHSVSSSYFSSCIPPSSSSASSSSSFLSFYLDQSKEKLHDERNKSPISSNYHTKKQDRHSDSLTSDSLSMCTESLGFESCDDIEDLMNDLSIENQQQQQQGTITKRSHHRSRMSSSSKLGSFPPPISCIGKSGKPWVCFKSFREDGRFILKEIRIPTQEFMHACREDGRLMMHVIHSDDEILDNDDEDEDEDYDDDDEQGPDNHVGV